MTENGTDEQVGLEAQISERQHTPKSSASRLRLGPRSAALRSRLTNGAEVLPGIDGRSAIARRYRDIASQIVTDMGGIDRCSEARQQLIRRFAAASCIAEQFESRLANGEQIDIGEHAQLCSTLVRIAQRIGLNRIPKTVLSLHEYLDAQDAEAEEDVA